MTGVLRISVKPHIINASYFRVFRKQKLKPVAETLGGVEGRALSA